MTISKKTLPKWKKNLTQKQLRHLSSEGITSQAKLVDTLVHQRRSGFRCWDCEQAAIRAGVVAPRPEPESVVNVWGSA